MSKLEITAQIKKIETKNDKGEWNARSWSYVKNSMSRRRTVHIPNNLREALAEHKKYKNPKNESELIFIRKDGSFINNDLLYKHTMRYIEKIEALQ